MRLIDADALKTIKSIQSADFNSIETIRQWIDSAPTIEIIRCRECKWLDSGKNDSEVWSMCTRHFGKYFDVNADDFCSYGSRSEKPNNLSEIPTGSERSSE